MPHFEVKSPDGTIYDVEGPEGSTEAQALEQVKAQHAPGTVETGQSPQNLGLQEFPTQTPIPLAPEEERRGRIAATAQGLTFGAAGALEPQLKQAEQRYAEADPMAAGAYNIVGGLPYAMGAGALKAAPTLLGRAGQGAAVGGGMGAVTGFNRGEGGIGPRLENAARVGVPSAILGGIAAPAVEGAGALGNTAGRVLFKGSGTSPVAQEARQLGYVIPPNMAQENPSLASKGMSALGGKIKTQQAASQKNQDLTTRFAAEELGLGPKTQLSPKVFKDVREKAGQAYGGISKAMPTTSTDLTYEAAVQNLGNRMSEAAKAFPGLVKNKEVETLVSELSNKDSFSTKGAIQLVRDLRFKASKNFNAFDNPEKKALASSQREAAGLIEDLVERRLTEQGKPNLVSQYKAARQLIAKSHDIEDATNFATGEVSARDLAKLMDQGRPLTGKLEGIARSAMAFPKAFQDASTFGGTEAMSVLDAVGAIGASGLGHPEVAAGFLARPVARSVVLSNPYQNMALGAAGNARIPTNSLRLMDPRLLNAQVRTNSLNALLSPDRQNAQ